MKSKIFLISLAAAASLNVFGQKKEKDKVLANKTYTVEVTENNAKKPQGGPDELSFKGEKLNSKFIMARHKIPAAAYTVEVDSSSTPKTITFTSESKNQDEETIKWEGTITGDDIEGNMFITNKKGKTIHDYSFAGALKTKAKK